MLLSVENKRLENQFSAALTGKSVGAGRSRLRTEAPGKAANAGGVAVSGFEMSQNRIGRSWSADRLDNELRDIMVGIFKRSGDFSDCDGQVDYRRGADHAGFHRVAKAVLSFGTM